MGNTVRTFSSLGTHESEREPKPEQEKLGDSLETLREKERLGEFLANRAEDDDIDSIEAVRDVREDI